MLARLKAAQAIVAAAFRRPRYHEKGKRKNFPYVVTLKKLRVSPEADRFAWCEANLTGRFRYEHDYGNDFFNLGDTDVHAVYSFERETDAAAFKLVWG